MTVLSLASVLREPARRYPHSVALVDGEDRLTYRELWHAALRVAGQIRARGSRVGDPVALLAPNSADFVAAYFGILAAGCVVVPVPTMLRAQEIVEMLNVSRSRVLMYESEFALLAEEVASVSDCHAELIVFDPTGLDEPDVAMVSRQAEDPAVVFFTSGTTGQAKGAVLTNLNLVMNATVNAFDLNEFTRDDVTLGCLPLFHTYGQTVTMNAIFRVGARLVVQRRFDPIGALDLIKREGITSFIGVPTMFVRLLGAARTKGAAPQLASATSGGASLPVAVLREFEAVFGTQVFEGYGLSETSPTCAINQRALGTRAGSVGHPIWGTDVEIADPDKEEAISFLPQGAVGEVVVRGHSVFAGYEGDPAATSRALVDGWFRTGDLGAKDAEGFIAIIDRKKDLIIRGGYNVYPREVEEVIAQMTDVLHVAVIGTPDHTLGEEVCAVVVPVAGAELKPGDVVDWARRRLGGQKYPRLVVLRDEMPMGPSQKVLKRELRAWVAGLTTGGNSLGALSAAPHRADGTVTPPRAQE